MLLARRTFALLYSLGAASALALEVTWTRQLSNLLGSSVLATSCVLAAFMGGFGLGAWWAARRVEQVGRPLRAFALAQAAGALLAWLPPQVAFLPPAYSFGPGLLAVLIAALPLGWSFPLASRIRESDGTGRGSRTGELYALDSVGAVLGCLAAGLLLVPRFGLNLTLAGSSGAKLLVALMLFLLAAGKRAPIIAPKATAGKVQTGLLVLALVQGFALLGAETLWSRLLAFVLYRGSTTYAFVAMLASLLLSNALGAFASTWRQRSASHSMLRACWCAVLCGLSLQVSLALLLVLGPTPGLGALSLADLAITLAAAGPAGFFSGAVFAQACQAAAAQGAGHGPGQVLAANALGGVAGALAVPLVLVPLAGLASTLALLGGAATAVGGFLLVRNRLARGFAILLPAAILVAAFFLPLAGPRWTRHLGTILSYREGRDASVAVVENPPGVKRLFVDGIAVAGTDLAMLIDQKTLAHLPVLLHPHPRSALTIGFGSGGTSSSLLLHPDLVVDCLEIVALIPEAAPLLPEANGGLLQHPQTRFHLHIQDARRALAKSDQRWDVIVNDCTDLAYRSDASLYTLDFFRQVHDHLNPSGIGAAWVPLRGERPFQVLRSVVGAFATAFPKISLWVFDAAPVHFGILVGQDGCIQADFARFKTLLDSPGLGADLRAIGLDDPWRLAASRQFDDPALRAFASGAPLPTDDRPVLEFLAPLESGDDSSAYDALLAIGAPSPPAPVVPTDARDLALLGLRWRERSWLLAGHRAYLSGNEELARLDFLQALRLSPTDTVPRRWLGLPAANEEPQEPAAAAGLGVLRLLEGDPDQAAAVLERVLDQVGAVVALGYARLEQGRAAEASALFEQVLQRRQPEETARRATLGLRLAALPGILRWAVMTLTLPGL